MRSSKPIRAKHTFWELYGHQVWILVKKAFILLALLVLVGMIFHCHDPYFCFLFGGFGVGVVALLWIIDYGLFLKHQLYIPLDREEIKSLGIEDPEAYIDFILRYLRGYPPQDALLDQIYETAKELKREVQQKKEQAMPKSTAEARKMIENGKNPYSFRTKNWETEILKGSFYQTFCESKKRRWFLYGILYFGLFFTHGFVLFILPETAARFTVVVFGSACWLIRFLISLYIPEEEK